MRRVFVIENGGLTTKVSDVSMDPMWAPIKVVTRNFNAAGEVMTAINHREASYEEVRDALRMALNKPGAESREAND